MGNLFAIAANWTIEPREITENDFYSTFNYSSVFFFFVQVWCLMAWRDECVRCARKCVSRRQHPNALLPRKNESEPLRALNWFVRKTMKWTGIRLQLLSTANTKIFIDMRAIYFELSSRRKKNNICPDFVHPNNQPIWIFTGQVRRR